MGLLVFDAARSFWGADDHGAGLDLDASEPFVGSYWSGSGVSWSMFMIVTLSSQVTDFFFRRWCFFYSFYSVEVIIWPGGAGDVCAFAAKSV